MAAAHDGVARVADGSRQALGWGDKVVRVAANPNGSGKVTLLAGLTEVPGTTVHPNTAVGTATAPTSKADVLTSVLASRSAPVHTTAELDARAMTTDVHLVTTGPTRTPPVQLGLNGRVRELGVADGEGKPSPPEHLALPVLGASVHDNTEHIALLADVGIGKLGDGIGAAGAHAVEVEGG